MCKIEILICDYIIFTNNNNNKQQNIKYAFRNTRISTRENRLRFRSKKPAPYAAHVVDAVAEVVI